jgi:branched-chain amino acid transport system substrate-binding protein
MQGFMTGLIFTECMRRADRAAGGLTRETVVQALSGLRDFDSGGLAAPFTNKNNRFPVARVWKVNTLKGIYEPASEWLRLEYD